jgi:hypothetical protein
MEVLPMLRRVIVAPGERIFPGTKCGCIMYYHSEKEDDLIAMPKYQS